MARDKVDRSRDPGASEFAGAPDDVAVGIVSNDQAGTQAADGSSALAEFLSAYWTNPADPTSDVIADGSNIGDTSVYRA